MLPQTYELPAAILLVLGGAVSCFAGYRLFRLVLGIYGFILGAMFASSMMSAESTMGMVAAAIVGGLIGAAILVLAYFVGIAIVGAALGALVAHVLWPIGSGGEPPALLVILLAVIGAVAAMFLQRYVIIVTTAFAGAWTMLLGVLAIVANRGGDARAAANAVWILYPLTPAEGQMWLPIAWVVLGLAGTAVQLGVTGRQKK
jgi:hypothetical protein